MNPNVISATTSWFKDVLYLAESMFGGRDKEWTYVGLEFKDNGPYVMYYDHKRISIVLSNSSINDELQLIFQLSHEVCHLLYPTGLKDANNLNEGVSTYFSKVYQERCFPLSTYAIDSIINTPYFRPYITVNGLLEKDPQFIIKLRQINSDISNLTFDQI